MSTEIDAAGLVSNECMLSTIDNPFNPFSNFNEWYLFDMEKGWDCSGRLARIAQITDDMSEEEVAAETTRAIDTLIKYDFLNIFIKVTPNSIIKPVKIVDDIEINPDEQR